MTQLTHDPYLNTVKRNLQDKYYKERYQKAKAKMAMEKHDFLQQNIDIQNYIHLPKGVRELFILMTFLLVPYIVGVVFVFILITGIHLIIIEHVTWQDFPMFWAIGYEIIASLLLIKIIKHALRFEKSPTLSNANLR